MTDAVTTLLDALHADPCDSTAWLALADALEESGQVQQAELLRLSRCLHTTISNRVRLTSERRLRKLLGSHVKPCVPIVTNSIGMQLALIPPGEFWMGSPSKEPQRLESEGPRHEVRITRPFYLGVYVVTQEEYMAVTGRTPAYFGRQGPDLSKEGVDVDRLPVEQVTWDDCVKFCQRLSKRKKEREANRVYRLPTEAEWEYACRAGSTSIFSFGNSLTGRDANFNGNHPYGTYRAGRFLGRTAVVGSYRPNAFGLYDMHGNVWEWCSDWHNGNFYSVSSRDDPRGPDQGTHRILRGGCWNNIGFYLRSAHRGWSTPDNRIGFRVAMDRVE